MNNENLETELKSLRNYKHPSEYYSMIKIKKY